MAPAIDRNLSEQLKAQGLAGREIARRWGTFRREKQTCEGRPSAVHGLPWTVTSPTFGPPWRPSYSRSAQGSKPWNRDRDPAQRGGTVDYPL